jgi:hypothetical protein
MKPKEINSINFVSVFCRHQPLTGIMMEIKNYERKKFELKTFSPSKEVQNKLSQKSF